MTMVPSAKTSKTNAREDNLPGVVAICGAYYATDDRKQQEV
jgi:hypothetical protein